LAVLVVDDQPDACALVKIVLTQAGAEVTTAGSARAALAVIMRRPPGVLVSDIGMPEEDGYMLINRVRALPPGRGGDIPAVALTAYASDADRDRALAAGYQEHVSKPVEPVALVAVIAKVAGPRG
jgi:CheY-like chemotaxis protein